MSLEGKVYAITGAGQGIGLATATMLASRGASVSLADANAATLADVQKAFQEKKWAVLVTALDVRNTEQVDGWINATVQQFGRLDGAANIAGVIGKQFGQAPIADLENDDWELVMGVNVTGTMNSMRAELRHLADGGSIVNISSINGTRGGAGTAAYTTSKHAVIGLTRCAARDYGSRGIRVNAIAPGSTLTPLLHNVVQGNPPPPTAVLGRFGNPDEIASAISWLLGPESTFVTGELYRVDGGEFC